MKHKIKHLIQQNKDSIHLLLFSLISLLFVGIFATSSDFMTAPHRSIKDVLILFLQWSVIMLVNAPFFYLISLNRYIYALLYPIITLFSFCLAYFRYTTGTIFTTMILDVALDHDKRNVSDLITLPLILFLLFGLLLAFAFIYYRFKKFAILSVKTKFLHGIFALLIGIGLLSYYPLRRPSIERLPMNLVSVPYQYIQDYQEVKQVRQALGGKHSLEGERPLVVFVLGETLRADHLQLNGYHRATTPRLMKEGVISLPNIYSEETYTNASIPKIMTRADSLHSERGKTEPSFIELFKRSEFRTSWISNQSPSKSFVYFMKECDSLIYANVNKSVYVFDKWTDTNLLPHFNRLIKAKDKAQLLILHTIGSHWYYKAHYTDEFEQFTPTTQSRIVSSNTSEEMINTYDNTILFTDYFICELIKQLKDKNALLIYLSDHGEALGEGGQWLHANEVEAAHNPACFLWFSEQYKALHPTRIEALKQNRLKHYRTDMLFHTILEGANIKWEFQDHSLSLFKQ